MRNNVVLNRTLYEYNKKYRNRNDRLIKYTKHEIDEYDRKNPKKEQEYLLKGRKWWYIDETKTFYEVPKAFRWTWFRNLNGAIQIGCCLLGAAFVVAAVTVPLVIIEANRVIEGVNVTGGAEFDKTASHIKLKEDSTIVLKVKTGYKIAKVKSLKIGDREVDSNKYTLDTIKRKINIKASALTSLKIDIDVDLKLWTRDEYVNKANEFIMNGEHSFAKSTTEYKEKQISNLVINDTEYTDFELSYKKIGDKNLRLFMISPKNQKDKSHVFAYEFAADKDAFYPEEAKHTIFEITEDYVSYETDREVGAGTSVKNKKYVINKYGYFTETAQYNYTLGKVTTCKVTYTGEPKEPEAKVVTKKE